MATHLLLSNSMDSTDGPRFLKAVLSTEDREQWDRSIVFRLLRGGNWRKKNFFIIISFGKISV